MTSPRQDDAPRPPVAGADPTRDIRLPSLPDRPPSVLPREWADQESPSPTPAMPSPSGVSRRPTAGTSSVDLRTDELQPPHGRSRERTLSFVSPDVARGRPRPTVGRTPRPPRRWHWVVLALLPVVVIVVSGLWWLLLLRAA